MNQDLRQSEYEEQTGNYGGVIIEPYRGALLTPIRSRPARRGLAHLRAIADDDDVPQHSFGGGVVRVFSYTLFRFVKIWVFVPILVSFLFLNSSDLWKTEWIKRWWIWRSHCELDCGMTPRPIGPDTQALMQGVALLLIILTGIVAANVAKGWLYARRHKALPALVEAGLVVGAVGLALLVGGLLLQMYEYLGVWRSVL